VDPSWVPVTRVRCRLAILVGGVVLGASAGCGTDPGVITPANGDGPPTDRDLGAVDIELDFDEVGVPGDVVGDAVNRGTAPVDIKVTTAGGELVRVGGYGGGRAVRTPPYADSGSVPAAAIVMWPIPGSESLLDPGDRDFVMGIDFRLDQRRSSRSADDGDNLVQRGRYSDAAQIKLQVDHGVPACRVVGSAASVFVEADEEVVPDRWYRLVCTRDGSEVRVKLKDLEAPEDPTRTWATTEDPGEIHFDGAPLSVAAKVNSLGVIDPASPDQFNGTIDRVIFDVLG
jgi:hypothetical protein